MQLPSLICEIMSVKFKLLNLVGEEAQLTLSVCWGVGVKEHKVNIPDCNSGSLPTVIQMTHSRQEGQYCYDATTAVMEDDTRMTGAVLNLGFIGCRVQGSELISG